jgi:hypothetical protein
MAELGRPGQIQKVKVEGGGGADLLGSCLGGRLGGRSRSRAGVAGRQQQEDQSEREGTLLHGGRIRNLLVAFNRTVPSSKRSNFRIGHHTSMIANRVLIPPLQTAVILNVVKDLRLLFENCGVA